VHDRQTFSEMHMDTVSLPARKIVPRLLKAVGQHVHAGDPRTREALELLAAWDHSLSKDSAEAVVYEAWVVEIARAVLRTKLGEELFDHYFARRQWTNTFQWQVLPALLSDANNIWWPGEASMAGTLAEALDRALDALAEKMDSGPISEWRWGTVHRITFASPLSIIPEVREFFSGGTVEVGGDGQTVLQSMFEPGAGFDARIAPSWRQIVDLSDPDAAIGINNTGQSGNPASPHYRDMVGPWALGEYHALPFTRPAVERNASARLILEPGG
jgi:acyl-homoserine lactone acylase PvdQ